MRNASEIRMDAAAQRKGTYCPCCGEWVLFSVADDQDGPDVCLDAVCVVCLTHLELFVTLAEDQKR